MRLLLISLISILFINCSNNKKALKNFKLLPSVQEIKYNNGLSDLNFENIKFAYSDNNIELPIRYDFTKDIQINNLSESTINYSIDPNLNVIEEGYKLNIYKNKIFIIAKDEKGLFYAFITLDQLIEDSKDQKHKPSISWYYRLSIAQISPNPFGYKASYGKKILLL